MNTFQAKRIPLKEILAAAGCEPFKEVRGDLWFLSPFRQETKPSFKVNIERNIWYDFGIGKGGSAVDFALHYFNVSSVSEALRQLEGMIGSPKSIPSRVPAPAKASVKDHEPAITIQKIQPLQNKALIEYLSTRGIEAAIAHLYVQEMYYLRGDKRYFALAFPNQSGGYELRNPYFKGSCGHKDISIIPSPSAAGVMVFEGFLDFISALVWHKTSSPPMPVIVLNSVAMRDKAIETLTQMEVKTIHLYLDLDPSGRALTAEFQEQLTGCTVIDQSGLYKGHKDMNAYLMTQRQLERS